MEEMIPILIGLIIVIIVGALIAIKVITSGDPKYGNKKVSALDKKLLDDVFVVYKNIQEAWSNFDILTLKEYLSPDFYQYYLIQLNNLKQANQRNIVTDVNMISINKDYYKPEGEEFEKLIVTLKVNAYNYVIDSNTNEVVRGIKNKKVTTTYKLTLLRKRSRSTTVICPNCGRATVFNENGECQYCGTFVLGNEYHFMVHRIDKVQ